MAGELQSYVNAFLVANEYLDSINHGNRALSELQRLRDAIETGLSVIQSSTFYTPAQKQDAAQLAIDLRDAIIAFADSIRP